MAFLTVTPDELRSLANNCRTQSDAIGNIGTNINSNVTGVDWQSPAADRFRGDWTGTHLPNLKKLQESLQTLAQAADSMASSYDEADRSYQGG